ncbi:MAG: nucleotidyltransferase domain-containing protein [Methanosarcinales archaeon]
MKPIKKIKEDLKPLDKYEVVIFGSYVKGECTKRSDIDLAVVTREFDKKKNLEIWKNFIGKVHPIYDLRIFELLPLKIKASVMNNYLVVFGERLEISEYFYKYRKLWGDCKRRIEENQFKNYKEKIWFIKRRNELRSFNLSGRCI